MKLMFVLSFVLVGLIGCMSAPWYAGPTSAHFDGRVFTNTLPQDKGLLDIFKFSLSYGMNRSKWPASIDVPFVADAVVTQVREGITATVINHSTVLIQVAGVNILTDPIFAERASPFSWAGPKRVVPPAISLQELPPIDVVLISHNHYDHLDIDALVALKGLGPNGSDPLILAGLGNKGLFSRHELPNHRELDWGGVFTSSGVTYEFVETRHRSGRGILDQMKTLWGGFVITTPAGKIYFGGDTGYGPHFREAREKHGGFVLCFLPIGAYEPRWFMAPIHLNPEEAVLAHQDLGSQQSIAIHHSTFQLTYEAIDAPKIALQKSLMARGLEAEKFRVLSFGEQFRIK